MKKVIIIGAGPAGMMAGISAAECGHSVILLEKNDKIGKKLFITGKGRCNITNASEMDIVFDSILRNRKFLYSAFYTFDNKRVIDFFEDQGVATKIERGNRVFPNSDHSSDVIRALGNRLQELGVEVRLKCQVQKILIENAIVKGVQLSQGQILHADALIIATGGCSYPSTGSTGDGYRFASEMHHKMIETSPALVPIETKEDYVTQMQGLSLKNVKIQIKNQSKTLYEDFGEMLFTHFGVSGPMILSASSMIGDALKRENLKLFIDLKPAISYEQLDQRILKIFREMSNKQFKNIFSGLLPSKMIAVITELSGLPADKKVNEISREERKALITLLKEFPVTLTKLRDFNEAIITRGGIDIKEVNPSTMESKLITGVFFAGEVLDLDAKTGGFNLQIAWSTGFLAGISI
ncbi:MAG: NAD(P)/FAD-dependent oxidoreductase [Lachnospiraceae bacterium]